MRIIDLLRVDCIKVPLRATTRDGAIDELVNLLVSRNDIEGDDDVAERIKSHELTAPTNIHPETALPHEVSSTARRKCLAIGKFNNPIQWGKQSDQKVRLVFLFIVPEAEAAGRVHIQKLLLDILISEIVQKRLGRADTAEDIYNILVRIGTDFDIPPGFKLIKVLRGHSDVIHTLAWSPDGKKLASGGAGTDQGRVWDTESGNLIALLKGHSGSVFTIRWAPDGKLLASGCADHLIRLWGTQKFDLWRTLDSGDEVYGLSWSSDSSKVAAASHLCMVRLWDRKTGTPCPGAAQAHNIGYCVSWSPDDRWLAAGGGRLEPSVNIWDPRTGRLETSLIVPSGAIFTLSWSPDGKTLAAGSAEGSILIYEVETWRKINVLSGHRAQLTGLDFSYDGKFLASKADDGTVFLWHTKTWKELARLPESGSLHRLFNGIAFNPRALKLATLGEGGQSIRVWELDRNKIFDAVREVIPEKIQIPALASETTTIDQKEQSGSYDVFLCHNSQDKPEVMKIGRRLRDRGILPWLDEWNVRPGCSWLREIENQIDNIKSAAVFVGVNDFGPWQKREVYAFLRQFIDRHCPVIPVILSECNDPPKLPPLLGDLKWVDFRKDDPDPMSDLIWGITGERS